ncbi:hypothetical protein LCGC14_2053240 [marine sediment metagenome]|uniref:Uncharacterized protein n=1 Tax=marine sediment metagenome TaxID=412755 RepID=A0A0F9H1T3_9ZZZZ
MGDDEFRVLLDLLMVSDPWPLEYGHEIMTDLADSQARLRGYMDWIAAYHDFIAPGMRREIG